MLAALTGAGVYFADQYEQHRIATIISREESKLEAIKSTVLIETKSHVDAVKLTSSDIDRQLANDKLSEDERLDRIAIILESLMDTKEGYDHIRILSPLGKETIRLNRLNGVLERAPEQLLQDKSDQNYFQQMLANPEEKVLISRASLNVDNGQLDPRMIAMTRNMIWLRSPDNERYGLLVVNFNFSQLMDSLRQTYQSGTNEVFFISPIGMILLGGDHLRDAEFAADRGIADQGFNDLEPEVWSTMQESLSGLVQVDEGLFLFAGVTDITGLRNESNRVQVPVAIIYLPNDSLYATSVIRTPAFYALIAVLYAALIGTAVVYWRNLRSKNEGIEREHELAQSRNELGNALNTFKLAQEAAGFGVFTMNMRAGFFGSDDVTREIFDLPADEFPIVTFDLLQTRYAESEIEDLRERFERAKQHKQPYQAVFKIIWRDGSEHYIQSLNQFREDENGELIFVGVAFEITERVMREQAVVMSNAMLAQKAEKQRKLFSIISHELRTPASAISMLANQIQMPEYDRGELQSASAHLLNVIDDLRVAVNPDLDFELRPMPFGVSTLIRETERQTRSLVASSGLSLEVSTTGLSNTRYLTDPYRLRSVLTNLIRNSVSHGEGSRIRLSVTVADDGAGAMLTFRVEDDGKGIAADQLDRLFEPFERGDTNAAGTGVGMHLIKTWTEKLGGQVAYSIGEYGGACFTVKLRVQRAREDQIPAHRDAALNKAKPLLQGKRVLLVEDEHLIRTLTKGILEIRFGVEVLVAEDGHQALALLAENAVELILTDYFMPNMDGRELIRTLREDGRLLPIIALTAAAIGDEQQELINAGADRVLTKPLDQYTFAAVTLELNAEGRL